MDPSGNIGDAYRVGGLPVTVAIDRDGVVRAVVAGELTKAKFEQMAELAMGGGSGEEIAPANPVTTKPESGG